MSNKFVNQSAEYQITSVAPSGEQYIELRRLGGLTPPPVSASVAETALASSVLILVARRKKEDHEGVSSTEPIGMIRLVGDGHIFLNLTDVCVLPSHRGKGLASRLIDEMLSWIDRNAPDAYVSMIADPPAQSIYKKKGFQVPPGIGMARSRWGKMDGAS